MKNILLTTLLGLALGVSSVQAADMNKVTDLPDISLIGNFIQSETDKGNSFDVKEIEISIQHYLYPSVKANVFTSFHKEDDGTRAFGIEEAYVDFADIGAVLFPNMTRKLGVGAILGNKLITVGKVNNKHPEMLSFVDRPQAVLNFFGGEEGLSGEGGQLSYLLPLPFFSQIAVGSWTKSAHEEEEGHSGVEYTDKIKNARLWNSFSLANNKELELGLNYVIGNANASETKDKIEIAGLDLSYTQEINSNRSIKTVLEAHQANYGEEGEDRNKQTGGYVSLIAKWNPHYQTGIRYGILGKHGDEGKEKKQLALMATRQLTDTAKFRVQYNTGEQIEDVVYLQFIFGVGPHSHVLQ